MKIFKLASIALISVLALAGCAPAEQPIDGKVKIVASTNIWGDIAKSVGGDLVEVTSIIDDPKKDPHSYEATARDQLAVEKSNLVIANGGGYDDFIEKLAEAAGNKRVLRIASEVTAVQWQKNEHLWFSISAVGEAVYEISDSLSTLDEANAATYSKNADALVDGLTGVAASYSEVRKDTDGKSYFATESLADWLLADLGLINKTPAGYSKAIEDETDVAPTVMKESLDLVNLGKIDFLVVNAQTDNAQTMQIVNAAKVAGVKTVVLSEVLLSGVNFVEWLGTSALQFTADN